MTTAREVLVLYTLRESRRGHLLCAREYRRLGRLRQARERVAIARAVHRRVIHLRTLERK